MHASDDVFKRLSFKNRTVVSNKNRRVLEIETTESDVPGLIRELKQLDVDVYSCGMKQVSLEDIFSDIVKKANGGDNV